MSGISGLLGFQFWVDNNNSAPLEAMLKKKDRIPKERAAIIKELAKEYGTYCEEVKSSLNRKAT